MCKRWLDNVRRHQTVLTLACGWEQQQGVEELPLLATRRPRLERVLIHAQDWSPAVGVLGAAPQLRSLFMEALEIPEVRVWVVGVWVGVGVLGGLGLGAGCLRRQAEETSMCPPAVEPRDAASCQRSLLQGTHPCLIPTHAALQEVPRSLPLLQDLEVWGCSTLPASLGELSSLTGLTIAPNIFCSEPVCLPASTTRLSRLQRLSVEGRDAAVYPPWHHVSVSNLRLLARLPALRELSLSQVCLVDLEWIKVGCTGH